MGRRTVIATLGVGAAALGLAACSSYDQGKAEDSIQSELSGQVEQAVGSPITSASCPSDVELEVGTTFECTATLENGEELAVEAEITSDDGDASFNITPEELKSAAGG